MAFHSILYYLANLKTNISLLYKNRTPNFLFIKKKYLYAERVIKNAHSQFSFNNLSIQIFILRILKYTKRNFY